MPLVMPVSTPAVRAGALVVALAALPVVAVTVFVTRAHATDIVGDIEQGRVGWWILLQPAALIVGGALMAGVLTLGAVRIVSHRNPGWRQILAFAAVTVSVALLSTTPTEVAYDDGCNDHFDVAPAVAIPYLKAAKPENSQFSWLSQQTQMYCGSVSSL